MKVGIRYGQTFQDKPYTSKRVDIELSEVETLNPEETVKELIQKAKKIVAEERTNETNTIL